MVSDEAFLPCVTLSSCGRPRFRASFAGRRGARLVGS